MNGICRAFVCALSLLVASCASLSLPQPGSEQSTLLLLPFTIDNRTHYGGHKLGFHYNYEIVSLDGSIEPLLVEFKRRMDGDVLVIDSLPPGKYKVASSGVKPVGVADHTYSSNRRPLSIEFELKPKAITILDHSMNIELYHKIPGRSLSTTYSANTEPVTTAQRTELLKKLRALPNYDQWTLIL